MRLSTRLMQSSHPLQLPGRKPVAAVPGIGLRSGPALRGRTVSALPWGKQRQEPEISTIKGLLNATPEQLEAMCTARKRWQARVDRLGLAPVMEAHKDYLRTRIHGIGETVVFCAALAFWWYTLGVWHQMYLDPMAKYDLPTLCMFTCGAALWCFWRCWSATTAVAEFLEKRVVLKKLFQESCDRQSEYTSQHLAAEFCALRRSKLDLTKL